jgi:hypothetical protein
VAHRTVSGAQAGAPSELTVLRNSLHSSAKNHQTVWCVTGLSGEPTKQRPTSSTVDYGRLHNSLKRQKSEDSLRHQVALDCPVCHRIVRCTKMTYDFNGQLHQTPTVRWRGTQRTVNSRVSGAHRTVRCAHRQRTQPTARMLVGTINIPTTIIQVIQAFHSLHSIQDVIPKL